MGYRWLEMKVSAMCWCVFFFLHSIFHSRQTFTRPSITVLCAFSFPPFAFLSRHTLTRLSVTIFN